MDQSEWDWERRCQTAGSCAGVPRWPVCRESGVTRVGYGVRFSWRWEVVCFGASRRTTKLRDFPIDKRVRVVRMIVRKLIMELKNTDTSERDLSGWTVGLSISQVEGGERSPHLTNPGLNESSVGFTPTGDFVIVWTSFGESDLSPFGGNPDGLIGDTNTLSVHKLISWRPNYGFEGCGCVCVKITPVFDNHTTRFCDPYLCNLIRFARRMFSKLSGLKGCAYFESSGSDKFFEIQDTVSSCSYEYLTSTSCALTRMLSASDRPPRPLISKTETITFIAV